MTFTSKTLADLCDKIEPFMKDGRSFRIHRIGGEWLAIRDY